MRWIIAFTHVGLLSCGLVGCSLPAPPPTGGQPLENGADASTGSSGDDDDGIGEIDVDAAPQVDAERRATRVLTQNASELIEPDLSIACYDDDDNQAENSYYRVFDLAAEGISSSFHVVEVEVGVETADGGDDGVQPVEVRLHTVTGDFANGQMNTLATVTQQVTNQIGSRLVYEFDADVPAGSKLAVEVHTPGSGDDEFFIGANNEGQTAPSYLQAAECGDEGPVDLASIGFPEMHILLTVTGL
jgi:hypothetical protein